MDGQRSRLGEGRNRSNLQARKVSEIAKSGRKVATLSGAVDELSEYVLCLVEDGLRVVFTANTGG